MSNYRYKKLLGFDQIMRNFDNEIYKLKGRTLKGLIKAQSVIHESMDSVSPMIPVEHGNMRKSWFCVTSNGAVITKASPSFTNENKDEAQLTYDHNKALVQALAEAIERGKVYGPHIVFGFSAHYARIVHEMYSNQGTKVKWTRQGSGPQFFVASINRNKRKVLRIVAQDASIKS